MIAIALACQPKLLIADEPTTALDVTVQAQVLELLRRDPAETGIRVLLITHDLGVIAEMCERVAVMYAGQVVEALGRAPVPRTRSTRTPRACSRRSRGSPPRPRTAVRLDPGLGAAAAIDGRLAVASTPVATSGRRMPWRLDRPELVDTGPRRTSRCVRVHESRLRGVDGDD